MEKKALAYHGAVPMTVYGLGEKNIREVRTILAANGYFTLNMRDIADMGVLPPGGKKYHPDDWGSNDALHSRQGAEREKKILYIRSETEKSKKQNNCPKRRGPRWDSNPRGYEQETGPNHLRKGRHEPSSHACDRGHRGYKHWDRIWAMAPQDGI